MKYGELYYKVLEKITCFTVLYDILSDDVYLCHCYYDDIMMLAARSVDDI